MKFTDRISKRAMIGIVALATILIFSVYFGYTLNHNRIYKGISIGDLDVSGLTRVQAVEKVRGGFEGINKSNLTLKYSDKKWQLPYGQINARFHIDEAVAKAYLVGRNGGLIQRISDIVSARTGKKFDIVFGYDKQQLINFITGIQKEVYIPKKNASLVSRSGTVVVVPHSSGQKLDLDKAVSLADEHITKLNDAELELPIIEDKPTVLNNQLTGFIDELGACSTIFNTADTDRTQNIKIACSRINGTILNPGQVFSQDFTLKNRTTANGYKMAKAYLEDQVIDEIGGGVCQVTTTLYDAVLLANLNVVERTQHSMMVDYVEPGFDAALSDKGVDLKFRNSYKSPIYLYSAVDGNKINMKVFGKNEDPTQSVQLETEVTEIFYTGPDEVRIDSSLPKGTRKVEVKSRNGYRAALYKLIYKDGLLISREKVSQNLYKPRRGKVKIGV